MNKMNLGVIAVLFSMLTGFAGQASAESAMQQLQEAAKSPRHAAAVFDGSRLSR
jgi:hypothetical protein